MPHIQKLFVFALIIVWNNTFAFDLSSIALEKKKEAIIEAIQRDEYLAPHYTYESSIANFVNEKQCIKINHSLHQGKRQRSDNAFKWVIDVPLSEEFMSKHKEDIAKLDALVSVKLLEKEIISTENELDIKSFNRYRLTVKGWAASSGRKRNSCFYLGRAKHLSIIDVKEIEIPISREKKETAYQVLVEVGFPKNYKLPDWAMSSEVRTVFPLIDKLVNGYERKVLMDNDGGQWREFLSSQQISRMEKSGRGRSERYFTKHGPETKLETMLDAFEFDEHVNRTWSCISLPGESSNGVRVDKKLGDGSKYGVVIYDSKERSEWDDIEKVTKPHLEKLVGAGVLTSNKVSNIEGERQDAGKTFSGTVYKLSSEYQHIIDPKRKCIFLGSGKVNVVDIEILAGNSKDNSGKESIKYKYIMTYPDPPEWAKDKVLQAWWSDLKGALKYGFACEGEFEIDLTKERKMGSGAGSCWWAYDSVAEL
ncbi:hypothetical protein FAP94_04450 [Morganella morganii]|nr:hypothetical protein [Morganella morganii]